MTLNSGAEQQKGPNWKALWRKRTPLGRNGLGQKRRDEKWGGGGKYLISEWKDGRYFNQEKHHHRRHRFQGSPLV